MVHLLRLAVFSAFVLLALATQYPRQPWRRRRQRVIYFILFFLAVSLEVGLSRREIWPFSTWTVVSGLSPEKITNYDFEVIAADGRAVRVDPQVWQPASDNEILDGWVAWHIDETTPVEREELARFVLGRAERMRQSIRSGAKRGVNGWLFGPLAAPYMFRRRAIWHSTDDVPAVPFVAVRLVRESWDVRERFRDESRVSREIVYELRSQ